MLEKHYRGITSRAGVEAFWEEVLKRRSRDDVPPFLVSPKFYFASIYRDGIYLLALMTGEMQALFVLEFLHRVFDIYISYFGDVTARSITDNFSTAYQLLEEMLDNGHPMITEPNALNTLIAPPSLATKMASVLTGKSSVGETIGEGAMSVIPWRRANVVHVNNEIYFDIVEEIDCIVESNGNVVSNDVRGTIACSSQMSGTPDLTLIFANPSIIEDCSFHPCVRYARFEREQVVSFVPPDGAFQLMSVSPGACRRWTERARAGRRPDRLASILPFPLAPPPTHSLPAPQYRVVDRNPQAPIYCRSDLKYREGGGRLSFVIGSKPMAARSGVQVRTASGGMGSGGAAAAGAAEVQIEDVALVVSFPRSIRTVDLSSEVGTVSLDPRTNELTWLIGRLPRDRAPELAGSLHFAPSAGAAAAGGAAGGPPLEAVSAVLRFTVANQTVSGLSVRDLQLVNERYKFVKGVKSVLRTGRFQLRV